MEDAERFETGEKIFEFINQVLKRKITDGVHRSSPCPASSPCRVTNTLFFLPFLDSTYEGSILEAHAILGQCVWWRLD